MSEFWMGVLAVPLAAVAIGAALVVGKALLWIAARILLAPVHAKKTMPAQQRALFAATAYASKSGWFVAFGDVGFAVFRGQDVVERKAAYYRVRETISFADLTTAARLARDEDRLRESEGEGAA